MCFSFKFVVYKVIDNFRNIVHDLTCIMAQDCSYNNLKHFIKTISHTKCKTGNRVAEYYYLNT